MNIVLTLLGPLLNLLGYILPRGQAQAREPSTVVGVAELASALSVLHLSPNLSTSIASAIIALLGVYNVYRTEHAGAAPAPVAAPPTNQSGPPR